MNRAEELLETVKNIKEQSYFNKEIIIIENGSNQKTVHTNCIKYNQDHLVKYVVQKKNLGVSGGRNVALNLAKGEYIIEIDDDAVFENHNAIENAVDYMENNHNIGILGFKITNYYSGKITKQEYPFRNKKRDHNKSGLCTWFIGAGHMFSREILLKVGFYRDFFPWGSEEQDFSIRAIDSGFSILYFPTVNVYHKKSPQGRIQNPIEFASIALKNRIKVALLNLPVFSIITYILVRGLQSVLKYKNLNLLLLTYYHLKTEWSYIKAHRKPIKSQTILKLIQLKGQVFY